MHQVVEAGAVPAGVTVAIERVTPEIAKGLLKNAPYQRKISQTTVEFYARMMTEGLWHFTGEAIMVDWDGNNANGRHRLLAIISSGRAQNLVVVRGIDPDSFDAMDQGKSRTFGDTLTRAGFKNADAVSSTVNILRRLDTSTMSFKKGFYTRMSREEMLIFASARADRLNNAVSQGRSQRLCSAGILGSFFYLVNYIDTSRAEEYFDGLKSGANLDEDSPILRARNALIEMRGLTANGADISDIFPLLAWSWNKFYTSERVKSIRIPKCPPLLAGMPSVNSERFKGWI